MSATITVRDEMTADVWMKTLPRGVLTAHITVRDLIRKRVCEEVQGYNQARPEHVHGLIQPTAVERVLNGDTLQRRQQLDWEEQYRRAIAAFERNGFFILVDNRQVESLDDEIELKDGAEISFITLVPLVG